MLSPTWKEYNKYFGYVTLLSFVHAFINKMLTGNWVTDKTFTDNPMFYFDIVIFMSFYWITSIGVTNKLWLAVSFIVFYISQLCYYAELKVIDTVLTIIFFAMLFQLAKSEVAIKNHKIVNP